MIKPSRFGLIRKRIFLSSNTLRTPQAYQTKIGLVGAIVLLWAIGLNTSAAEVAKPPNILLIMADDLGFSDLGCYGGEIQTPHLDQLADQGLRFTQFYNTGRCWPTRASLLTGYYPQSVRRDKIEGIAGDKRSRRGNRGSRPHWAPLICMPLKDAGYRTYHTGKWHIDRMPIASGFDRSYYLKDQHRFFNPTTHWKDDKPLPPVAKGTDYYATVALGDHVLECLDEHQRSHSEKPFFHYLAFAAPHFPLHALPEDIDRYRERYRTGWESLRESRWKRIQKLGIVSGSLSVPMRTLGPPYAFPDAWEQLGAGEVNLPLPWNELTEEQQRFQSTKMAIHAAMIDCMDRQIGRVLERLREQGEFDRTLIVFLSDNGASAEIMVRGDGHDRSAPMGSWASHLCLGPGWSTVANTPFRYHKTWNHEGGIATPLIVHWGEGIQTPGKLCHQVGHVIDIWPTLLEVAGVTGSKSESNQPIDDPERPGVSLASCFLDGPLSERTLWWSHEGNRALRQGDWKISYAKRSGNWELYNLAEDRAETVDLANVHPKRLDSLTRQWDRMNRHHAELADSQQ